MCAMEQVSVIYDSTDRSFNRTLVKTSVKAEGLKINFKMSTKRLLKRYNVLGYNEGCMCKLRQESQFTEWSRSIRGSCMRKGYHTENIQKLKKDRIFMMRSDRIGNIHDVHSPVKLIPAEWRGKKRTKESGTIRLVYTDGSKTARSSRIGIWGDILSILA